MLDNIRKLKEAGDFAAINQLIPYAGVIGLEAVVEDDTIITILRKRDENIGNYVIGAIHGGVVAALLEHAAFLHLLYAMDISTIPRIINLSVDYLRPCLNRDTFARATLVKQGRRIANVRVEVWQDDPARPSAAAHAHFLLT